MFKYLGGITNSKGNLKGFLKVKIIKHRKAVRCNQIFIFKSKRKVTTEVKKKGVLGTKKA